MVPNLSAISGLLLENTFTNKIPVIEQISPSEANIEVIIVALIDHLPAFELLQKSLMLQSY